LWLPPGAKGVRASVGSPNVADREQAMVAVSSKVVTAWAAAVKTLSGLRSPHQRGKEHYQCQ